MIGGSGAVIIGLIFRAGLMRVRVDPQGVRVVNMRRTHRLSWSDIAGFSVQTPDEHEMEKTVLWPTGCVELRDGRRILTTGLMGGGNLAYWNRQLHEAIANLNRELLLHTPATS